jgi:hypothetical protein
MQMSQQAVHKVGDIFVSCAFFVVRAAVFLVLSLLCGRLCFLCFLCCAGSAWVPELRLEHNEECVARRLARPHGALGQGQTHAKGWVQVLELVHVFAEAV